MPTIDTEKTEYFAALHLEPAQEVLPDHRRVTENFGLPQPRSRDPVPELEAGENSGRLGGTDSFDSEQLGGFPSCEFRQTTGGDEKGVGLDHRSPAPPAGSKQDREKLRIRKDRWTELEQTLTGP